MNILDFVLISIVVVCAWVGYQKGLVRTLYRFVSFILALFLAGRLYPIVAGFLRDSALYDSISGRIASATSIENAFRNNAPAPDVTEATRGTDIINSLPLPDALRNTLYERNTPDMFELLGVRTVEEHITGFFANIVINAISLIVVFVLVLVILHFIGKALNIVDMIPIVSSFNRAGGLGAGVLIGIGVVWLAVFAITMFFATGVSEGFSEAIQGSSVVSWMLDRGWMVSRMTQV